MKTLFCACAASTAALLASPALAETCGDVSIAQMNWASAATMAQIDKIILEEGYGCNVDLTVGDSVPTFTSMTEKSDPDIAPEMWVNSIREPLEKAVNDGTLVIGGKVLKDGGPQGFWIPAELAERHNLKTLDDVLARPDLFQGADDTSKGAFFTCPSGWDCGPISANLLRAWQAEDKGFEIVPTGSSAGLEGSIARAMERGEGWFGYYWGPTALLGKYDMTLVDFGVPFNQAEWTRCTSVPDCSDPQKNAWERGEAYTLVTSEFAKSAGVAMDYIKQRGWDNKTASSVLAWIEENQADPSDGAYYFLENHADVWTAWVSAEVADKVKSAL
ncbi:glycine betaine/proline transport system substrate-binding protein [Roseibium hamelinense]|uniref:Glycine betaine/proline transport system substrate-binding protein n=1 Tax=Roseibium hamelinense TaxID=150831 RepID=A0A562THB8_9HYPH|nr:glycine betaine ABC transporter substrate-binding protein [Roseibium hamelinense]MTI45856.1 ABC transporter substrate-binding protein [Roseibium hamelinense]TWI92962.1 glycine betaine/proline transport system substrate-binding protein [Roseibium hamelinense]